MTRLSKGKNMSLVKESVNLKRCRKKKARVQQNQASAKSFLLKKIPIGIRFLVFCLISVIFYVIWVTYGNSEPVPRPRQNQNTRQSEANVRPNPVKPSKPMVAPKSLTAFKPENRPVPLSKLDREMIPRVRPFDYYKDAITQRNIFQMPWEVPVDTRIDVSSSIQLSQQLRLVGVFLDGNPKAIIEDAQSREIHFVSKGDRVGTALLHEIGEGRAIFIYKGKKVELVL
jgi:hypothetical protein